MKDFGISIQRNTDWTYSVTITFRPMMEDMFETAVHVARFKDEAGARKLAAQVKLAFLNRKDKSLSVIGCVDKRYWQGPTSVCSPVQWNAEVGPYCVLPAAA
jgi:hypothetical protein